MKFINKIISIFTHCYVNGNNNKVCIIKNGKKYNSLFKPFGLNIKIEGSNNTVTIEFPIRFSKSNLLISGDNNSFYIKSTRKKMKDITIDLCGDAEVFIDENSSIGQGDFHLVAGQSYKNRNRIVIGKNFRAAKDTMIRSCDGHSLIDPDTNIALNEPQDIIIGDNVWLMTRCMIVKGSKIPSNSAVAPYSFVNKKFDEENILLAGIPAKILKHNIKWDIRSYVEYMKDLEEK